MSSKKQIKELMIKITSPGGKEATAEIRELSSSLANALTASEALTTSLKTGSKYLGQTAVAYASMTKSIQDSTVALKALNSAINGDTVKATKNINAYIDNIQLLTLYLSDAADVAKHLQQSLSASSGSNSFIERMDRMIEILEALETTTFDTSRSLGRMDVAMEQVSVNTGKAAARLKQARDNITDLDVTTNRGNESLTEYAARLNATAAAQTKAGKSANTHNNQLKNLNGTGSQAARSFSKLAFGMNPLVSTYAAIAVNVYALSEAFRLLKDAAALERLEEQTAQFAASVSGVNVKGLARDLQGLAGGALDAAEALKQAVRGISFGFSPELLKELTEGARKASVALGRDFTDSMDRVIRGISKGEVELLDELGVVTRLETAFKNYARTTGLEADKLTDSQRKLALAQEVNLQLATKYASFNTAANSMERLGTATTDSANKLLKSVAKAIDPAAASLASFITNLNGTSDSQLRASESYEIYTKALKNGDVFQAAVAWDEYSIAMGKAAEETKKGTLAFDKAQVALWEQKQATETLNTALGILTLGIGAMLLKTSTSIAIMTGLTTTLVSLAAGIRAVGAASTLAAGAYLLFTAPVALTAGTIAVATAAALLLGAALNALYQKLVNGKDFTDEFSRGLSTFKDMALEGAEAVGASVKGLVDWSGTAEDATYKTEALKLATEKYNQAVKSGNMDAAIRAKAALQYLKDTQEASNAAGDAAKALKLEKTEADNLYSSLQQLSNVNADVIADPKSFKALENTFENLKTSGVIAKDVAFDMGKGFGVAAEGARKLAVEYKKLSDLEQYISSMSAISNRGKEDEEVLNIRVELNSVTSKLAVLDEARKSLNSKINEEEYKALGLRKLVLEATEADLLAQKSLAAIMRDINTTLVANSNAAELAGASRRELLGLELKSLELQKQKLGTLDTTEIENSITLLKLEMDKQKVLEERASKVASIETAQSIAQDNLEASYTLESDTLKLKIAQLEQNKAIEGLTAQELEAITNQVKILENKLRITKQQEEVSKRIYGLETDLLRQQRQTDVSLNNVQQVAGLQKELDLEKKILEVKRASGEYSDQELLRQQQELDFRSKSLEGQQKGASIADYSSVLSSMSGIEGLSSVQSAFSSGLGDISGVYSEFLAQSETGTSSFLDYLKSSTQGMSDTLQAGLSIANSVFQEISAGKVASIEREIEAEQRRDGKSAESLAKIKKLQAQQIKEEAKAKRASVLMSTSVAIMQAFAQLGPFGAPVAAVMAGLGALQVANIDKAANGQLAALNGSSSGDLTISSGSRDNSVDVARNANAGELAYLSGASGSGTANNFTPGRSGFGTSSAGTSIIVGESGPEEITPLLPVNVSPAGSSKSQIVFSPNYQLSAIDSSGMEELMMKHTKFLYEGLEKELNARNQTLTDL